jgi:hypothetical protein
MKTGKLRAAIRRKYKTPAHAVAAALDCSLEEAERLLADERAGKQFFALDEKGQPPMAWRRYAFDQGGLEELLQSLPDGAAEQLAALLDDPQAMDGLRTGLRRRHAADQKKARDQSTILPGPGAADRRYGYDDRRPIPLSDSQSFDQRFPSSRRIGSLD